MSTDLMDALGRWRQGEASAQQALIEQLQPLLQELIARLRPYREAFMLEGVDCSSLAQTGLQAFLGKVPKKDQSLLQDWHNVEPILTLLVQRTLQKEGENSEAAGPAERGHGGESLNGAAGKEQTGEKTSQALASWLERFQTILRSVHPKAIDMVDLRLDGHSNRDLAQRLGMGLRLVQRVFADMRQTWEKVTRKE